MTDKENLKARIAHLEDRLETIEAGYSVEDDSGTEWSINDLLELGLTRRQALKSLGALAIYGGSIWGAVRYASQDARAATDQVGTSSQRVDLFADAIDSNSISTAQEITDPANVTHTTELAEASDLFSGSHTDLSNIQSDQHHTKYTDTQARTAVEGNVDAADLVGDSGSAGQSLQTDGSVASWADVSSSVTPHSNLGNWTIHQGYTNGNVTTATVFNLATEVTILGGFIHQDGDANRFDVIFTDGNGNKVTFTGMSEISMLTTTSQETHAVIPPVSGVAKLEATYTFDREYSYMVVTE